MRTLESHCLCLWSQKVRAILSHYLGAGVPTKIRKLVKQTDRKVRETRMFVRAMQSASHPVLVQIVPIRRCNLDCAYCNEYDKVSNPVPLDTMLRRIDYLADLGTTIITLSGGEPTLHPDLDTIIRRIRERGAIATLITNGYLLTPERIWGLNSAGLDYLQTPSSASSCFRSLFSGNVAHRSSMIERRRRYWPERRYKWLSHS
jgi:uncharacterized radical SAM superfamily Fe-S cluster-containing enzyme